MSLEEEKNNILKKEEAKNKILKKWQNKNHITFDNEYNVGLRAIREYGYLAVCTRPEVKYYCMCNGIY